MIHFEMGNKEMKYKSKYSKFNAKQTKLKQSKAKQLFKIKKQENVDLNQHKR